VPKLPNFVSDIKVDRYICTENDYENQVSWNPAEGKFIPKRSYTARFIRPCGVCEGERSQKDWQSNPQEVCEVAIRDSPPSPIEAGGLNI
jgi:hypothetical protein